MSISQDKMQYRRFTLQSNQIKMLREVITILRNTLTRIFLATERFFCRTSKWADNSQTLANVNRLCGTTSRQAWYTWRARSLSCASSSSQMAQFIHRQMQRLQCRFSYSTKQSKVKQRQIYTAVNHEQITFMVLKLSACLTRDHRDYLAPRFIYKWNKPYLPLHPNYEASLHFGQTSFPIPCRVRG